MKHERLAHLINLLHQGGFSRNRHFDAHLDPEVADAKARQLRLTAIVELLGHDENHLEVCLEPLVAEAAWLLKLHAEKWRFRWQAKLLQVEIDWLRLHPPAAAYIERLTSTS